MIKLSKLFKVTAKTDIKPVLQKIYIKDKKAYATNGYVMTIMPVDIEGEGFLSEVNVKLADSAQKITKTKEAPNYQVEQCEESYPDIDHFIEGVEANRLETPNVIFSRQSLIDTLEAMQGFDNADKVEMYFTTHDRPVVFKNGNGTGIVMPCKM